MDISPFSILDLDGSYSLVLTAGCGYMDDLFKERENEGLLPNGYGWEALAMAFIETECPEYKDKIDFDSESGMFCAYSSEQATLESFVQAFKAACEDGDRIRKVLAKADPERF